MLYILSNFESALTQFIFSGLHRKDTCLIQYDSKPASLRAKLARWLEAKLPNKRLDWYYPKALIEQLDAIGPADSLLIFAMGNTKDIHLLRKYLHGKNVSVFLWNPVLEHSSAKGIAKAMQRLDAIQRLTNQIYSFDQSDVQTYGLHYAPQPFRSIAAPNTHTLVGQPEKLVDFFFLGYDKGRLAFLTQFKQAAQAAGLSCTFHILADPGKTYLPHEQAMLSTGYLSYADNITQSQRARCLIDIVQANQSGATMRGVEALFLNKKLITTRQQARHEIDYDPSRTYVLKPDEAIDGQALLHFMQSPLMAASNNQLNEHEINNWLNRFY